jgi:hypothetical protein
MIRQRRGSGFVADRSTRTGVQMAGTDPREERAILVVARGQNSLLEAVRELFAEIGWVNVIEDRRGGPSLLPRADREDTPSFA